MADRLGDRLGALKLGTHPLFVETGRATPSSGGGSTAAVARARVAVVGSVASFRPGSPLVPNRPNQIEK